MSMKNIYRTFIKKLHFVFSVFHFYCFRDFAEAFNKALDFRYKVAFLQTSRTNAQMWNFLPFSRISSKRFAWFWITQNCSGQPLAHTCSMKIWRNLCFNSMAKRAPSGANKTPVWWMKFKVIISVSLSWDFYTQSWECSWAFGTSRALWRRHRWLLLHHSEDKPDLHGGVFNVDICWWFWGDRLRLVLLVLVVVMLLMLIIVMSDDADGKKCQSVWRRSVIRVVLMMVMVMVKDAMVLWTQIELDPDLNDHQVGFQLPATEIEQVFTKKKLQSLEDALK